MSKQDRQGVRTPADLERKYDLGQALRNEESLSRQGEEINNLNQTLNQFMSSSSGSIEGLTLRMGKAEENVTALQRDVNELDGALAVAETDIFEHEQAILALEEKSVSDDEEMAALDGRVADIEEALPLLEERVGDAETVATEAKELAQSVRDDADAGKFGGGAGALHFQVENGDLYLYTNDESTAANFEYDAAAGDLYYVMEVD